MRLTMIWLCATILMLVAARGEAHHDVADPSHEQ